MPSSSAQGAIACGHSITARATEAMLRDGGNIIDVASSLVNGLHALHQRQRQLL